MLHAKYIGFSLGLAKGVTSTEMFGSLRSLYDSQFDYRGCERAIFVDQYSAEKIIGMILTFRSHRRYLEFKKSGNKVNKLSNTPGFSGVDVNLFAFNPITNKGIYQYYRGSMPCTLFAGILHKYHNAVLNHKKKEDKVNLSPKQIEKKYTGTFEFALKLKKGDIDTVLTGFGKLRAVRVSYEEIISKHPWYRPLKAIWTNPGVYVPLRSQTPIGKAKESIRKFAGQLSSRNKVITIIGESVGGSPLSETIGEDNVNHFGSHTMDDFIDMLPDTTWDDYKSCEAIEDITASLDRHVAFFGVE